MHASEGATRSSFLASGVGISLFFVAYAHAHIFAGGDLGDGHIVLAVVGLLAILCGERWANADLLPSLAAAFLLIGHVALFFRPVLGDYGRVLIAGAALFSMGAGVVYIGQTIRGRATADPDGQSP